MVSGKSSVEVPEVPVIISRLSTSSMVLKVVFGDDRQTLESEDGAPIQLKVARVVFVLRAADQRIDDDVAGEQAEFQPVLGRHVEHVVRRDHAAGALHVAHHHRRIARRHVPAEMARDQPRIGVGAAAGIEARDQIDRLAAVEVGGVLRRRGIAHHHDGYGGGQGGTGRTGP